VKPHGSGPRRIGLFGGSFDPVHAGHLHAARAALRAFHLDRVAFVPARLSPHKPGRVLASGEDRMQMLALATAGEPRFVVLGLELEREGPSYTIDTVRALPAALGEAEDVPIYLILGSDNLVGLESWREAAALIGRVQPVVVHRSEDLGGALQQIERRLGPAVAERIRSGYLKLPPVPASSTAIRARLSSSVDPVPRAEEVELAPAVHDYIRAHGLYGAAR
jgi:nicotinate-nucleotide adenylyltransferase